MTTDFAGPVVPPVRKIKAASRWSRTASSGLLSSSLLSSSRSTTLTVLGIWLATMFRGSRTYTYLMDGICDSDSLTRDRNDASVIIPTAFEALAGPSRNRPLLSVFTHTGTAPILFKANQSRRYSTQLGRRSSTQSWRLMPERRKPWAKRLLSWFICANVHG